MRQLLLIALFVASTHVALAQDQVAQASNKAETVVQIKTIELRLSDLIVKGSWDEYEKFLTSDYVRTFGARPAEDRERALATLRSDEPKIVAMIPEEMQVRLYGDVAIVTGSLTLTARQENKVHERHAYFTEVFVRRSDQWFLSATHITFLGK